MRGVWFCLATASFVTVAYFHADALSALAIFGVACCFGLVHEVINA